MWWHSQLKKAQDMGQRPLPSPAVPGFSRPADMLRFRESAKTGKKRIHDYRASGICLELK